MFYFLLHVCVKQFLLIALSEIGVVLYEVSVLFARNIVPFESENHLQNLRIAKESGVFRFVFLLDVMFEVVFEIQLAESVLFFFDALASFFLHVLSVTLLFEVAFVLHVRKHFLLLLTQFIHFLIK